MINNDFLISCKSTLDQQLASKSINLFFQPIASLVSGKVTGYEVFCRGPEKSLLVNSDTLFKAAEFSGRKIELEYLCKHKTFEQICHSLMKEYLLFLNLDISVIEHHSFFRMFEAESLRKYGRISPSDFILEIRESNIKEESNTIYKVLSDYRDMGYKIAVDRVGGFSCGLKLITEANPQYVKLDTNLVRDIDKNSDKQSLVRNICEYCSSSNKKTIAVGVETQDELKTLIEMGINYAQGYLLGKPDRNINEIPDNIREFIIDTNKHKFSQYFKSTSVLTVGDISIDAPTVEPDTTGEEVMEYFNRYPSLQGIPVLDGNKVAGLVMKDRFLSKLATQYGVSLFMRRPIKIIMDNNPLVVDYGDHFYDVSKFATARPDANLYDYIIVKKDDCYYGVATVKDLLEKSIRLEATYTRYLDQFTGFPGKMIIDRKLSELVQKGNPFSVLFINFRNYEDYKFRYGAENGDRLILMLSRYLKRYISNSGNDNMFIGYSGRGEFIITVENHETDNLCNDVSQCFDEAVEALHSNRHFAKENLKLINKSDEVEKEGICIGITVINNQNTNFGDKYKIYYEALKIRRRQKKQPEDCCA